jgi:catechol 2,3-dioxygenase-like lactoylglutathione lyase family enzyme
MTLEITGIDHIVLNVRDADESLAFYQGVLGLAPERLDEYRAGAVRYPSVRVSADTIIDLVPAASGAGALSLRNVDHYCFMARKVDFAALLTKLEAAGVTIVQGPRSRWGARGRAESIYILDPDGNQIEIKTSNGDE